MIITDCHMPDMDGYEMAREIRKIETTEDRPRIPIIAWTANALKEEHERIEAAGMDELLVKPVSLQVLRRMLAKWLTPHENEGNDAGVELAYPDLIPPAPIPPPIDYSVLDAIMTSKAEQSQLLRDFLAHIRSDCCKLNELLAQDDCAATQRAAHRMKGSSNMVGALRLGDACATIEQAAKNGNMLAVRATMVELDEALQEIVKYVG
jgi:two-component system, NarL family, sensor histidine kinase EvgS